MVRADRRRAGQGQRRAGRQRRSERPALTSGPVVVAAPLERARRGPLGLLLLVGTLVGAGIAGYLTAVKLLGASAVCGPSHGCDMVAASEYATLLGIPVAVYGLACSIVLVALAITWWRLGDRRALLAAYLMLLAATGFVAYLTFLELFVIKAICLWCVAYAITVVVTLVIAGLAMRSTTPRDDASA